MLEQLKKLQQPHIDEHLAITEKSYVERSSLSTEQLKALNDRQRYITDYQVDETLHSELIDKTLSLVDQLESLKHIND